MNTALDRASHQTRPAPSPQPSTLANWTLVHTRANSAVGQLQNWVANDASADELGILLGHSSKLLFASVDDATQKRLLSAEQAQFLARSVAEERAHLVAMLLLAGATTETLWHSRAEPGSRRADCGLTAAGAIAGFWACQIHLAASIERAIVRLGLRRELLQYKSRHSARCARHLLEWGGASHIDLRTFPGTHRVASGINSMVDRFCAFPTLL